jgi:hypothetical protein
MGAEAFCSTIVLMRKRRPSGHVVHITVVVRMDLEQRPHCPYH